MAYQGDDPAPLLPAFLRNRLKAWLYRASGYLVLLACVAGSLSLLSWSVADPSLTHATRGATRNLLGPAGAILSDLLMQTLGLACVFFFLPPIFWALQLLNRERVDGWRVKLMLAPVAMLLLAGALSSLPPASAWPLSHGFGGFLGDRGLGLFAGALSTINPERASAAAGLFYFAAGMMVLVSSLGLSHQDLRLIWESAPRLRIAGLARWRRRLGDLSDARRRPTVAMPRADDVPRRLEPRFDEEPRPHAVRAARSAPVEEADDFLEASRGRVFDHHTDEESLAIARRFAPERDEQPPSAFGKRADDRRLLAAATGPHHRGPAQGPQRQTADRPRPSSDDLYERAVDIVLRDRKASTNYLGRRLSTGYAQAAELIERMEREGLIGPPAYNGQRRILIGDTRPAGDAW